MAKKKNGRPRKEINWKAFDKLCHMQCTLAEIAGFFNVSEDTIERRVKEEHGDTFAEVHKKKAERGRSSLRRKQFQVANSGNVTMLIWLGKQYFNQRDKTELSGPDGGPIQHAHDLPDDVLAKIITEGEKKKGK